MREGGEGGREGDMVTSTSDWTLLQWWREGGREGEGVGGRERGGREGDMVTSTSDWTLLQW